MSSMPGALRTTKKPRIARPALASRVVRPLPAPGEAAVVGFADWQTYQRLDESYTFAPGKKDRPDLVIEVALSSGGIDKLEFWSALGAAEVWIWQNNRLHGFARGAGEAFEPITASTLLPGLPLELVHECAALQPASQAVKTFKERLTAAGPA
jgi:hypothetical protein